MECGICQLAATVVDSYFLTNMTQTEIDAYTCVIFPSSWQQPCQSILNDFLPTMMQSLKDGFAPDAICAGLRLCKVNHIRSALQAPYRRRLYKPPKEL